MVRGPGPWAEGLSPDMFTVDRQQGRTLSLMERLRNEPVLVLATALLAIAVAVFGVTESQLDDAADVVVTVAGVLGLGGGAALVRRNVTPGGGS